MDIRAARSFRVLLAVTLAANCCLPCYTLAYADESQGVESVSQEEQEKVAGDSIGVEFSASVGESSADGADGGAAAKGYFADDESAEGSSEDLAPDNGRLAKVASSGISPLATSTENLGMFLGNVTGGTHVVVSFGGGQYGANNSTLYWSSLKIWERLYLLAQDVARTVNYLQAIDTATKNTSADLKSAWGNNYATTPNFNANSPAGWLRDIRTRTQLIIDDQKSAWGNNYAGTPNYNVNSPAGWLRSVMDYSQGIMNRAQLLVDDQKSAWGNNYSGTPNYNRNSPAGWLRSILDHTGGIATLIDDQKSAWGNNYASTPNYNANSPAGWLREVATYTNQARRYLVHHDPVDDVDYSIAAYGSLINQKVNGVRGILDSVTVGPEGGRVSFYNIGNSIETIKNETRDLDNLLEDANTLLGSIDVRVTALDALGVRLANIALTADDISSGVSSSLQWYEILHCDLSMLRHGAADLLPGYADWTLWDFLQGIYFDIGQIVDLLKGLQQTLTAWGNRWDSQDLYLMEWAKRWDALDKSPADLSEINTLLGRLTADVASIRDKYVVGDTLSDMFGALVGDLQVPATAAAIDGIKGAMSTAFPFCIPSVVNLVLFGSVVVDPQAPCWEFDIVGNPLVIDFADFEDFAEVCRWTVRLLFVAALLLNTRKFVYGVGGAY